MGMHDWEHDLKLSMSSLQKESTRTGNAWGLSLVFLSRSFRNGHVGVGSGTTLRLVYAQGKGRRIEDARAEKLEDLQNSHQVI